MFSHFVSRNFQYFGSFLPCTNQSLSLFSSATVPNTFGPLSAFPLEYALALFNVEHALLELPVDPPITEAFGLLLLIELLLLLPGSPALWLLTPIGP